MDTEQIFDNVNRTVMFNMMTRIGIKYAHRRHLYNLYQDELPVIKIKDNLNEGNILISLCVHLTP